MAALPNAPMPVLQIVEAPAPEAEKPLTLRKLPVRFVTDEVHIFTSPVRVRKADLKWLLPLGAATAAALTTDTYTMRQVVSHNSSFNDDASTASEVLRETAIGVPILMFLGGSTRGNEQTRETGLLGGEAMIDAYAFDEVVKYAFLRERPYQDDTRGQFFSGGAAGDPSFISGHCIVSWSSAAILAERYNKPWEQAGIYTLASGVALSRVLAYDHFPTDVLLGSAAGWLIGHYVYRAHHHAWPIHIDLQTSR